MRSLEIRHKHAITPQDYWDQLFFSEAFNKKLYLEGLGFRAFEVLSFEKTEQGEIKRRVRAAPATEVPAFARKIVGSSVQYTEEGRFDPQTKLWTYRVYPEKLPDKVDIRGDIRVEPRDGSQCERICQVRIEVSVFGIGSVIEKFIEESTRAEYEKVAQYTNRYIAEMT